MSRDGSPSLADVRAKMAATRQALRQEFIPPPPPPARSRLGSTTKPGQASNWWQGLAARPMEFMQRLFGGHGLGSAAVHGASRWWYLNPLRSTAQLAGSELASEWRRSGIPLLQRYPVTSVVMACSAGAAVVLLRPWRSARVKATLRPLPRKLGRWAVRQLPVKTMLTRLLVMLASRRAKEEKSPTQSTSDTSGKVMNRFATASTRSTKPSSNSDTASAST